MHSMNPISASAVRGALASLSVPVFLAGCDGDGPAQLTLHVAQPRSRRSLRQEAQAALAQAGIDAHCRVRALKYGALESARSLEGMIKPFAHDSLVYDPTESVTRARALIRCGERLRRALGSALNGIYFEPDGRTLFLVCRPEALTRDGEIDKSLQRRVEAQTAPAIAAWQAEDPDSFAFATRLCIAVPRLPLVAVDEASPVERASWRRQLHSGIVAGGVAALLGSLMPGLAHADDSSPPAVSQVNGKISAEGGIAHDQAVGIAAGTITAPVGHSFGFQLDAAGGTSSGSGLWGLAAQGFWRNPKLGMLGGFVSHSVARSDNKYTASSDMNRYGAEGAYYLGQFTPSASVGLEHLISPGGNHNGPFGTLDLAWYPNDNLMLSLGGDKNPNKSLGELQGEYQLGLASLPGLSVFAEGASGGNRDNMLIAGFRYYFGPAKTLIRRHREDDPPSLLTGMGAIPNYTQSPAPSGYTPPV
jgi:hypothetical protein